MLRVIAILSLVLMLFSCKWKTDEKPAVEAKESPEISSLSESGLPCFKCHPYTKFSLDKSGTFSHTRHIGFGVHCNQCHLIKQHQKADLNKDICSGCHNLTGFTFAGAGMPVIFSHQNHTKKYNCSECHPKLFSMKKGATKITMDAMYKGDTCGKCHNGKTAFASTDCTKCHKMTAFKKEISYPSGGLNPAIFSHEFHTAMFDCNSCHTAVFKFKKGGSGMKMDQIYQGKFCGSCHNGQTAFGSMECQKCHK